MVWPSAEMMAHSSAAVSASPEITTSPERPVVQEDVEQHQDQAGDAGAQAGLEGGLAEGGRDGLGGQLLEADGQGAELHGQGQRLGVGLGHVARR